MLKCFWAGCDRLLDWCIRLSVCRSVRPSTFARESDISKKNSMDHHKIHTIHNILGLKFEDE